MEWSTSKGSTTRSFHPATVRFEWIDAELARRADEVSIPLRFDLNAIVSTYSFETSGVSIPLRFDLNAVFRHKGFYAPVSIPLRFDLNSRLAEVLGVDPGFPSRYGSI